MGGIIYSLETSRPSNIDNGVEMVLLKSIFALVISYVGIWMIPS